MFKKNKKFIMATLFACGIAAPLSAMAFIPKASEAAVAVYDAQNVAEAIKMVTNTIEILKTGQAQLALDILNSTSLSPEKLISILQKRTNAQGDILSGDATFDPSILAKEGKDPGILNRCTSVEAILGKTIGNTQDIFDGRMDVGNMAIIGQRNIKALEASYQDAARMAQNVQHADSKLSAAVSEALKASNEAKGHMQIEQANTAISAAQVQTLQNSNELLANMLAVQAQKAYAENYERAALMQREKNSAEEMKAWVGRFKK